MALINILREQSAIGFNGRVVFQGSVASQYLGQVLISAGLIVGCTFRKSSGKKALFSMFLSEFGSSKDFGFVVEPEVISLESFQFELEVTALEKEIRGILGKSEKNKKLKPPANKRLLVNPDFICVGDDISPEEFDILCVISDFGKVEDIYDNSQLLDFEVTNGLVSLRKKGALKVMA